MRITRRSFVGAVVGAIASGCDREPVAPATTPAPDPAPDPAPEPGSLASVDALFEAIIAARPAELDALIARALDERASGRVVFEAALRATLLTRFDGADIHSMASIIAAQRVHDDAADALERISPLFFTVHFNHAWSQRLRVTQRPPSDPRALATSIEAEDYAAADRAMAGLVEARGLDHATRIGRELGTIPRGDLHAVIWTSHSANLADLAGTHRPLLLRSLARYLSRSPAVGPIPETRLTDPTDTTPAIEVARALRAAPDVDLSGLSPAALFGALAVQCIERRLGEPFSGGSALHYSTGFEAYWSLYEAARGQEQRAIVSRAVHRLRASPAPRVDSLALDEGPGDPFSLAPRDTLAAYRAALRVCANDPSGFIATLRARVARHGGDAHDYKLFGSLLTVADRLATDELRVRWLASAVTMNVMRAEVPAPHYEAALTAARASG